MFRTLFAKIFIWSAVGQLVTLGSILALAAYYLPQSEEAVDNAWSAYAHTAVALYEKFGPKAVDEFLAKTGEDTLLQLQFAANRAGTSCASPTGAGAAQDTTAIAAAGFSGNYCLTVHANAGGLPDSPQSRRSRMQLVILLELLGCAGLSYIVARYLSRPITELRDAARRLARGDLTARVGGRFAARGDEAADLVREFNQMAERLAELIQSQRRLIGDISHEIKSPLARLSVALGLARRNAEAYAPRHFERMQREIEGISMLATELLTLARLQQGGAEPRMEEVDLTGLVEGVIADVTYEAQARAADIVFKRPDGPLRVEGNETLLRRAVENVLRNAIFYTAEGIAVDVTLSRIGGNGAVLEIRDHGPGVPAAALPHLFEAFYRVDEARTRKTGGSGIGLAICRQAIELHGGFVRAWNAAPNGLTIEIRLPLAGARLAREAADASAGREASLTPVT